MFDWAIGGLGTLFGFLGDAAGTVAGWAWDKVITGVYRWLANGLALLIEWVWSVLDSSTTPRITEAWFRDGPAARVAVLGLAVTIAMMLLSAAQAAIAGRPEQIIDVVKESTKALVASALTITVIGVLMGVTDEASAFVWQAGRPDLVKMIEGLVAVATSTGSLGTTFIGPLAILFGFIALIGLVVSLMMRSALIYMVAALAPIVWSLGVLPSFRGSSRKLVHLAVSLVLSKLAIVITLVVAVKLIAHPTGVNTGAPINDAAAAVGTLMTGFVCFLIAAVTPMVLYKLMPTVEGAMVGSGIASGWTRGATTAAHTGLMVKSLGATAGASAATRAIAGQAGVSGQHAPSPSPTTPAEKPSATPGSMTPVGGPSSSAQSAGGSDPPATAGGDSSEPSRPIGKPASPEASANDSTGDETPAEPKAAES
jgi:hypothetical protein